jgi:hypothetical protein
MGSPFARKLRSGRKIRPMTKLLDPWKLVGDRLSSAQMNAYNSTINPLMKWRTQPVWGVSEGTIRFVKITDMGWCHLRDDDKWDGT